MPGFRIYDIVQPWLRPAAASRIVQVPATGRVEELARSHHHLLVTFRRDGSPVPVPLWAAVAGGHLYIRTERGSGKVKRLRRDSRALIAPATFLGRPLGPPLAATGRLLDPAKEPAAELALARAHGWYRVLFEGSVDRMGVDMCYLELTPESP